MTKRLTFKLRNGSQIYHREAVRPLPHSLNHLNAPLLGKYYGKIEIKPLISLHSWKRALWVCVPHLDIGDALQWAHQVHQMNSISKWILDLRRSRKKWMFAMNSWVAMPHLCRLQKRLTRLPPVVLLGHYAIVDTYCVLGWSAWRGPSYNYSYIYHPSDSSCPL